MFTPRGAAEILADHGSLNKTSYLQTGNFTGQGKKDEGLVKEENVRTCVDSCSDKLDSEIGRRAG